MLREYSFASMLRNLKLLGLLDSHFGKTPKFPFPYVQNKPICALSLCRVSRAVFDIGLQYLHPQSSEFGSVAEPGDRAAAGAHPRFRFDETVFEGPELRFLRNEID